jgi:hypothetical protein
VGKTALQAAVQDAVDGVAYAYWAAVEGAVVASLRRAALWDGVEPAADLFARLSHKDRPVVQTYPDGSARVLVRGKTMAVVSPPQVWPHGAGVGDNDAAREARREINKSAARREGP